MRPKSFTRDSVLFSKSCVSFVTSVPRRTWLTLDSLKTISVRKWIVRLMTIWRHCIPIAIQIGPAVFQLESVMQRHPFPGRFTCWSVACWISNISASVSARIEYEISAGGYVQPRSFSLLNSILKGRVIFVVSQFSTIFHLNCQYRGKAAK
jgi:hypothetical protein